MNRNIRAILIGLIITGIYAIVVVSLVYIDRWITPRFCFGCQPPNFLMNIPISEISVFLIMSVTFLINPLLAILMEIAVAPITLISWAIHTKPFPPGELFLIPQDKPFLNIQDFLIDIIVIGIVIVCISIIISIIKTKIEKLSG